MNMKAPPGTFDVIPNDCKEQWRNSSLWDYVEQTFKKLTQYYNYKEIRTPIFERAELFQRGVGESSDIVLKEMYTFEDNGGRKMSLRPEGTASVLRAFVEHHMHTQTPTHKLFYIGPMFRYERPQSGRYRQFHHLGAEAIGNGSPEQDVELIDLACSFYRKLGLRNLTLHINSIGNLESRKKFREALQDFLHPSLHELSADSQRRFEMNPLRILDSKAPEDQKILQGCPSILDFLDPKSADHFEKVKSLLNSIQQDYVVNPKLVRGLDYYVETVFEIMSDELGAQNTIGGGGRYDGLLKQLGGPDLPCIGFATGIERVIITLLKQAAALPVTMGPKLFIISLGEEAKGICFKLLHDVRSKGISAEMDFSNRKLAKIMQYANDIKAQYVAVVGENELKTHEIELKNMESGITKKAPLDHLANILHIEEKSLHFLKTWNEMSQPFEEASEAEFFKKDLEASIGQTQTVVNELSAALQKINTIIK